MKSKREELLKRLDILSNRLNIVAHADYYKEWLEVLKEIEYVLGQMDKFK